MASQKVLNFTPSLVVFDFDGVFTDNKVYVREDGAETVMCDRGDGMGIEMVRTQTDIPLVVLSKERNAVVARRCEKLKVRCFQSVDDKPTMLQQLALEYGADLQHVIYMGNDANDVECMKMVGLAACPKDAYPCALEVADIVMSKNGGCGAVRELCETILNTV